MKSFAIALLVYAVSISGVANAQEKNEFFERNIRPVLIEHCYRCHNSTNQDDGGLVLDHRDGLLEGGITGPAIKKGSPDESILIQVIRHEHDDMRMPKDNAKLSGRIIKDFEKWISNGAYDPRDTAPSATELAKATSWEAIRDKRMKHWSFQPVQAVDVPKLESRSGQTAPQILEQIGKHPVDQFIARELAANKTAFAEKANRRDLIRRLSYVLTGLPPSYAQVKAFEADTSVDAFEKLVDKMLNTPQFGERWARHWMDWLRFAESHGSEGDPNIPYAWRYRDYLIRALNQDVSYKQLVLEHIAGDLLAEQRINDKLGINESVIGLGHYRFVEHGYGSTDALEEQVRFTDNQIDVITKAFQGLTVSCARCHDHKFDPISQKDFYALYGVMRSSRPALVNADTAEKLGKYNKELETIKAEIKNQFAIAWMDELEQLSIKLAGLPAPTEQTGDNRKREQLSQEQQLVNRAFASSKHPLQLLARALKLNADKAKNSPAELKRIWQDYANQVHESQQRLEARRRTEYPVRWSAGAGDFNQWAGHGAGSIEEVKQAGAFTIAREGDKAIDQIHPTGVYSHLRSTKQNGVLNSPDFDLSSHELWVRVAGGGNARVRYSMFNNPRVSGPVYKAHNINHVDLRWVRWDMKYWLGDRAFIEIATANDVPVEARNEERSWFGISEIVLVGKGQPVPRDEMAEYVSALMKDAKTPASNKKLIDQYMLTLLDCIRSWQSNRMNDSQAHFLNRFIQDGLLSNRVDLNEEIERLVNRYRELEKKVPVPTRTPGIVEGEIADQPLFIRGNHKKPSKAVPRRYLEAINDQRFETTDSGRLELAQQMVDPSNPLTSRVIVNRIWHHVFGKGLVDSPDNFGLLGSKPTHPELLDYLAGRFAKEGHSLKKMIKLLVTSRTFQSSSLPPTGIHNSDPNNQLLSYIPIRRLDAESIRDSLLLVSGRLDSKFYGPSVNGNSNRRSVYVRIKRNSLDQFLGIFDAPAPYSTVGKRHTTNVPAQALAMMNSPMVNQLAVASAASVDSNQGDSESVKQIYQNIYGRSPTADETKQALQFISSVRIENERLAGELNRLTRQLESARKQKDQIRNAASRILEKSRATKSPNQKEAAQVLPTPIVHFEFDGDLKDSIGNLDASAIGGKPTFADGGLKLDGRYFVASKALQVDLKEKTLELSVKLADLEQRGGGLISIQSRDGGVFDSIVYGEKQPRQWLAGSNFFARTEDLYGPEEKSTSEKIHLVFTYASDGKITAWRNGVRYGKAYRKSDLHHFPKNQSQIILGMRHGTSVSSGRMFLGTIFDAKVYDRALTEKEIKASANSSGDGFSKADLMNAMSNEQRASFVELEQQISKTAETLEQIKKVASRPKNDEYHELTKALINSKEFIYIR